MAFHPIGHELARHENLKLAGITVERPELRGLQPTVECASAAIATKAQANGIPSGLKGRCMGAGVGHTQIFPTALHWRAPP